MPEWFNFALLIPAPLFSVILAIVISPAAGINFSIITSFILLPIINFQPLPSLFSLFTAVAGVMVVQKIEKRIDLIFSGIKIGFFQRIFYCFSYSFSKTDIYNNFYIFGYSIPERLCLRDTCSRNTSNN